ncbi:MAG: hypothetical protein ACLPR9_11190 [Acidimicrobiales bacterium]
MRFTHNPERTFPMVAKKIARERDVYRLEDPPVGMDANIIDDIWRGYEPKLPLAVKAFEEGTWGDTEWSTIWFHICALGVRHPAFTAYAMKTLASRGDDAGPDDAQRARVKTLSESQAILSAWRFAVIERPPDSHRFITNDKGYASVTELDERNAVFFPLSANVGILGAVGAGDNSLQQPPPPHTKRVLTPSTVEALNEVSWQVDGVRCVIGHPDDHVRLLRLKDRGEWRQPQLGPYRGKGREGLLDWAFG